MKKIFKKAEKLLLFKESLAVLAILTKRKQLDKCKGQDFNNIFYLGS